MRLKVSLPVPAAVGSALLFINAKDEDDEEIQKTLVLLLLLLLLIPPVGSLVDSLQWPIEIQHLGPQREEL